MKQSTLEQKYLATDDEDEHLEIFSQIVDELNDSEFAFLMRLLQNHQNLDEFVVVEILKVFTVYIPEKYQSQAVEMLFKVLSENDDDLVKVYAVMAMDFMPITHEQRVILQDLLKSCDDSNLKASLESRLTKL